ncbi:MAG: tRNA (adenosine(37)-N6)-threonylcarbamoyltransferase complex ATPase subunit type 1 TsaE [Deltaproteobacteria bacterium]|nr:tRNA (adenosine(37)-N6)-threonylcarbamoyltransferase complex ATPase subunit type 1 TsaE [Deltaproteobacteria bacterium]
MEVFFTDSPEDTEALGASIAKRLEPETILALTGELGSGKTHFVKGLAKGLGIEGYVKSPSFMLLHIYEGGGIPFFHIDLYRIEDKKGFEHTGLEEYVYGNGISAVEWAEKWPEVFEDADVIVSFFYEGESRRRIEVEYGQK